MANPALRRVSSYLWAHRIHIVLCVPMLFGVTVLHEAAHALAVILQGRTVTDFSVWPGNGNWGYIEWQSFPQTAPYPELVSLAPYLLWLALVTAAVAVSLVPASKPFWMASTVFVWLYAVPVLDIANAVVGYTLGPAGDLSAVFPSSTTVRVLAALVAVVAFVGTGFAVQQRLYGPQALRPMEYGFMSACSVLGIMLLTWLI